MTLGLIVWAAGSCPGPNASASKPETHAWGGRGIQLEVAGKDGRFELDCAHGTLEGPLEPDARGRFEAGGHLVRERGGPEREGEEAKGEPARFAGTVKDDTMTLSIRLVEGDEEVGRFTLTRGKAGRLRKCL